MHKSMKEDQSWYSELWDDTAGELIPGLKTDYGVVSGLLEKGQDPRHGLYKPSAKAKNESVLDKITSLLAGEDPEEPFAHIPDAEHPGMDDRMLAPSKSANKKTYGNNKEWFKEMTEAPDSVIKMPPSKPYGPLMEGKHGLDIEEERMRGIEDTWENEAMGEAESYRGSAYDPLYGKSEEDEPESKQMSKGQVQALIKLGGLLSKQAPDAPAQRAPVAGVKMGRTPFPNQNFLRGGKQKREYFRPRGF